MKPANKRPENDKTPFPTRRDHPDKENPALDSALEESFPASDPASVSLARPEPAAEPAGQRDNPGGGKEKKASRPSEDALDKGLEESFPASDPVSVSTKKPHKPAA
jgi:hypothetical protein